MAWGINSQIIRRLFSYFLLRRRMVNNKIINNNNNNKDLLRPYIQTRGGGMLLSYYLKNRPTAWPGKGDEMNDIKLVQVASGFWLQVGEDVYKCELTSYKQIPVVLCEPPAEG